MTSGTLIAPPEARPLAESSMHEVSISCECGDVLRVFGGGRHRVYFEPGNTKLDVR